jgi:tetratricopeptide (TPR) repeat protein
MRAEKWIICLLAGVLPCVAEVGGAVALDKPSAPVAAANVDLNAIIKRYQLALAASDYPTALREGEQFEAAVKVKPGPDSEAYGAALHNLALVYQRMGKLDLAESFYLRAKTIRETKGKKPDLAWTLFNLSNIYLQQKKYDQVEQLLTRTLQLREQSLGKEHLETAQTLHNLGMVNRATGKYAQAAEFFRRSLAIRERSKDVPPMALRWTFANLALVYDDLKDREQSGAFARRALDPNGTGLIATEQTQITSFLSKLTSDREKEFRARYAALGKIYGERKYREVLRAAPQFIEEARQAVGEDNFLYGAALMGVGDTVFALGDYRSALDYYKKAVAVDKGHLSVQANAIARSRKLGWASSKLGDYAASEGYYRQALQVEEGRAGKESADAGSILEDIAGTLVNQRRYDEATVLYLKAQSILSHAKGAEASETIGVLHNLAWVERRRGNYAEAERLHRQGLTLKEQFRGADSAEVASSLRSFSAFYREVGRYDEAEQLLRRALSINLADRGVSNITLGDTMQRLAAVLVRLGKYDEGIEFYKKAITYREKEQGHGHPETAWGINNLGDVYFQQGRFAEAEPLFEEAANIRRQVFGPDDLDGIPIQNNVVSIKLVNGDVPGAIAILKESLKLRIAALGEQSTDVAYSLSLLREAMEKAGNYDEALRLQQRALAIREAVQPKGHPEIARALYDLAGVYQRLDRQQDAADALVRSIEISLASLGERHPHVADSLQRMSEVYRRQGRIDDAVSASRLAIRSTTEFSEREGAGGSGSVREDMPTRRAQLFKDHAALLYSAAAASPSQQKEFFDEALSAIQRAGQSSASRAIQKASARIAGGDAEASRLIRTSQDITLQLAALDTERNQILAARTADTALHDEKAGFRNVSDKITQLETQLAEVNKKVDELAPRYKALVDPRPLDVADIQRRLQGDEAVVIYVTGDKGGLVLAVSKDSFGWGALTDGVPALSEKVKAFRRGLDPEAFRASALGGKPDLFSLGRAYDLYAALLGPVEAIVGGKARISVIPDGPLTSLPFHLLVTEKPAVDVLALKDVAIYREQPWLIRRSAVKIVPSISNLGTTRSVEARNLAPRTMIAFGDPVFDPAERRRVVAEVGSAGKRVAPTTRAYTSFWQGASVDRNRLREALPTLLDSGEEVRNIGRKLGVPQSDILVEKDASEANVKRRPLADYQIVYFATHGLVAGDVKGLAEPSLALTIPDVASEDDDGLLTLSEVSTLNLNAELVVLSACNTIAGDRPGAEALTGLARAFFYAGAKAMIVSHWGLASDAATRLMTDAFGRMQADRSLDRSEALRRAMLSYMEDRGSPLNGYPAYWAPFVLVGGGD